MYRKNKILYIFFNYWKFFIRALNGYLDLKRNGRKNYEKFYGAYCYEVKISKGKPTYLYDKKTTR